MWTINPDFLIFYNLISIILIDFCLFFAHLYFYDGLAFSFWFVYFELGLAISFLRIELKLI